MKFLLIIGKNVLYTYQQSGSKFEQQFIEGSDSFAVNPSSIGDDILSYMNILADEKNLGTIAKLEFDVLECPDLVYNSVVMKELGDYIDKVYSLTDTLNTVIKKLLRDKKLMIDKYGINYEGYSYKMNNNDIAQGEYDLLAYTIHSSDLVGLMDA